MVNEPGSDGLQPLLAEVSISTHNEEASVNNTHNEEASIDTVLDRVGGLGRYQIRILVLSSIVHGVMGMIHMSFLFVGRPPKASCSAEAVGSCKDDGSQSFCHWSPSNSLDTYAAEFQMVCSQDYLQALITTIYFAGYGVGSLMIGQLSDKHGRKCVTIITLVGLTAVQIITAFAPNYQVLACLKFALGFLYGGVVGAQYTWVVEFMTPNHRALVVAVLFACWGLLNCLNSLFAYLVDSYYAGGGTLGFQNSWRALSVVIALPTLMSIPCCFFVDESPRYFLARQQPGAAMAVLRKIAAENRHTMPDCVLHAPPPSASQADVRDLLSRQQLYGRPVWLVTVCGSWMWFVIVAVYYGAGIFLADLPGSIYVNVMIMNLIQVPIYAASSPIGAKLGHKAGIWWSMFFCGLFSLVFAMGCSSDHPLPGISVLAYVSYSFVTLAFSFVYTYSAELFPTDVRAV
jgi:MFS family permease